MTKNDPSARAINRDLIIDHIYQVALEPSSLDDFINLWHDTSLSEDLVEIDDKDSVEIIGSFKTHLDRAQTILQRGDVVRVDLANYLQPYDNLAAFVVGGSLIIEASNTGAQSAFGAKAGDALDQLHLPAEMHTMLLKAAREVLHDTKCSERLIKVKLPAKRGAILFRTTKLNEVLEGGPAILIVSTHFHWRKTIGTLLGDIFKLTNAEQNVVRLLVEGQDIRSIAAERETSEGTVRGQIKSITSKMNLRSQTDIVRLVMTLGDFPKGTVGENKTAEIKTSELSNNWFEVEVWKTFKSISLSDGRSLTYHDMGPPTGHPVLLSHTGSCLVRWSSSMIKLAFEHNLRIICPIRAGYGASDSLDAAADPIHSASADCAHLLQALGIARVPYIAQGTDFPFAADFIARYPNSVSELIGFGARPCLPDGEHVDGVGRWQRFFVSTARNAPHLVQFASKAVMAMSKRIGSEAMLHQLCKDSPSDLALLKNQEIKQVLIANINLMAVESTNAARAFALEYIAFQKNWSDSVLATHEIPVKIFIADEDPTIDIGAIPRFEKAYPWMEFKVMQKAGLALTYQKFEILIPIMAAAAKRAAMDS